MPEKTKKTKNKARPKGNKKKFAKKSDVMTKHTKGFIYHMPLNKHFKVLPDRYCTLMRVVTEQQLEVPGAANVTTRIYQGHKANSVQYIGPAYSSNGPYGNNVPTGIEYLLSSASSGVGAGAPYSYYIVKSSKITHYWTPKDPLQVGTVSSVPNQYPFQTACNIVITILPVHTTAGVAPNSSTVGDAFTQVYNMSSLNMQESPYAKWAAYPSLVTTKTKPLTNKVNIDSFTGNEYKSSIENGTYTGSEAQDPGTLVVWMTQIATENPDSYQFSIYGSLRTEVEYYVEFYNRNVFNSIIP